MMLAGIHHVAIIAGDYARSKRFYCQILGLRVLDEHYRQARDSWKLDLALPDGGQIELFSFPAAPARPSRPEAQAAPPGVSRRRSGQRGCAPQCIRRGHRRHPHRRIHRPPLYLFADPDELPLELYEVG